MNATDPWGTEANDVAASCHDEGVGKFSFFVIIQPLYLAPKHHYGLGTVTMAVDRHHRAGLQSVEHTLALVGRGVAQVKVHP